MSTTIAKAQFEVQLDKDLHRALKIKSREMHRSISELVEEAVRNALTEDAIDLAAIEEYGDEPTISFEEFLKELRRDGKI